MTLAVMFVPLSKISAEENLAAYIHHAKAEVATFGSDLDFEADVWDITEFCISQGQRNSHRGKKRLYFNQSLDGAGVSVSYGVRNFSKAYLRSEVSRFSVNSMGRAVQAFRFLDSAMGELHVSSLCECDAAVFSKAVALVSEGGMLRKADSIGFHLSKIARFLDENKMAIYPIGCWKYIKQRKDNYGRVGDEFEKRRLKGMPSIEAIEALPKAFNLATTDKDILVTSVAAILCSAPERINEVLVLSRNCEVDLLGDNGGNYLGLRWAGSKGFCDHVKLVLPGMADVVREALRRIIKITEPARKMAKWYEINPTRIYLPSDFEYLRDRMFIELEEMSTLLGFTGERPYMRHWVEVANIPIVIKTRGGSKRKVQAVLFSDFERFVVSQLPLGFPIYDVKLGLKYSDALLVVRAGTFNNSSAASLCMFEPLQYHHVSYALGQNTASNTATVFQRVGLDPDRLLAIKPHQFRHYLNTLAQKANLSQVDIAKWSGRTSIAENAAYDHVSSEEIVSKIRAAVGDHTKAIGPLAEIPKALPVSRAEFAQMVVPTAHVTLYGFCIHDFTTNPCELFRQCIDCREHVCIKGVPGKVDRVSQALSMAKSSLAQANVAVENEMYGAEDWVGIHLATVKRLEQLLTILTDPNISDGAVIQLSESGVYSLSRGAIRDYEMLNTGSLSETINEQLRALADVNSQEPTV